MESGLDNFSELSALRVALQHHLAGRLAEAEKIYRKVLETEPDNADALVLLGQVSLQAGQIRLALELITRAVRLRPSNAFNLNCLGNTFRALGRVGEAEASFRRSLEQSPGYADAHNNLGLTLSDLGRLAEAEQSFRQCLTICPEFAEAHNNLGNALRGLGRIDEAARSYRQSITFNSNLAEVHNNLGDVLRTLGQLAEAEQSCRRALALKPELAVAYINLGNVLRGLERFKEAERSYGDALLLNPDLAEAHHCVGGLLAELRLIDEAEDSYRRALALRPNFPEALDSLGFLLGFTGRLEEAEACHRQALRLKPDFVLAHSHFLSALSYFPSGRQAEICSSHREFGLRFSSMAEGRRHGNSPDPGRKLRIGYVSADLRDHAVAFFFEPILENHDRKGFEVYCYANSARSDEVTLRLKRSTDHWRQVDGLSDESMSKLICEDAIDILVDLSGHTTGNRLPVFGRKPAPVQVTYLGYPTTTGLAAMDYRLTDAVADPEAEGNRWNTEQLVRLPGAMWCFRPSSQYPAVTQRPPGWAGDGPTFASLNNFPKLNSQVLALWARLLCRLPTSKLIITNVPGGRSREAVVRQFTQAGITANRLAIYDRLPRSQFVDLFSQIDIALDPFPYGGTTTTCDLLWMGVPVVTRAGETTPSRSGMSLLQAVGLGDLVAQTEEQYLEIAEQLSRNSSRLTELRGTLRERMRSSYLMDAVRFTRHLEQAYRTMWGDWCRNRS